MEYLIMALARTRLKDCITGTGRQRRLPTLGSDWRLTSGLPARSDGFSE